MAVFPSLVPTKRDITIGRYPVKSFQAIDGVSTTRLYGSKKFDSTLALEFSGINDADVLSILDAFDASYGGAQPITLPDTTWKNIDPALTTALKANYTWKFVADSPPQVQQMVVGRYAVSLSLVGTLST